MVPARRPLCFIDSGALPAIQSAMIGADQMCLDPPMAKENPMKLASLALLAGLALAGFATAQTPPQSSAPPAATAPPAQSSEAGKIDRACKKEIKDLCGHAHGQEMKDCVKAGLDMNKFSASCKSEIAAHKDKS